AERVVALRQAWHLSHRLFIVGAQVQVGGHGSAQYEGCGRAYLGAVEGAHVLKLHRFSGKRSYLVYPDFDTDPHPGLRRCVKLSLRTREREGDDYAPQGNPPVLHRKETFLAPAHPLYPKLARLTRQAGGAK